MDTNEIAYLGQRRLVLQELRGCIYDIIGSLQNDGELLQLKSAIDRRLNDINNNLSAERTRLEAELDATQQALRS